MKIYLVGGAVRDELLGLPVSERDWVVVGATPQDLLDREFKAVGKDFPIFLHPQTGEEYALARTERKTGHGYYGFETRFGTEVTLEQDLQRRDLTINAMARDPNSGYIVDPFGGQHDLRERVLRHVSAAFIEDPLRVLRVARFMARFATLGFTVAPETLSLMREIAARGELQALVPERVWQETQRALELPSPWQYFEVLRAAHALPIVFPEVAALFGVPQPEHWHPEIDSGIHTMMVLEQAAKLSPDTVVRFAALTHDLGKGTTPPQQWPRHVAHEERSAELTEHLCKRLRIPNLYRDLAMLVGRYHLLCHKVAELRASTVLDLLTNLDALRRPERFEQFILACEADARGRKGLEHREYPQACWLREARECVASIVLAPPARSGLTGLQIAQQLRTLRLEALRAWRSRLHPSTTTALPPNP